MESFAEVFTTRPPAVAGLFYPAQAEKLTSLVQTLIDEANTGSSDIADVRGLIAPHAGYVYSGSVAADAFRQLTGTAWDLVVILSPSHREMFRGISIYPGDFETPLGIVRVDKKLVLELAAAHPLIQASWVGHRQEHGIEVELPFLQTVIGDFELLPIVMGTQDWDTCQLVVENLWPLIRSKRVLIVASSDLSHFHPQEDANVLDHVVVEDVEAYDSERFYRDIRTGRCEACGSGPILVTMELTRKLGSSRAQVVSYQTSGNVNRDYTEVVGYLAGVMSGR